LTLLSLGHSVLGWEPEILWRSNILPSPRGYEFAVHSKALVAQPRSNCVFPCRGVIVGTEQFIDHASVAQIHNTIGTGGTHRVMRDHQDGGSQLVCCCQGIKNILGHL